MNEHIYEPVYMYKQRIYNQRIYNQLISDERLRIMGVGISTGTIVITNLPQHITRYFTKIVLNYNPINNKIHLRTDSADEDIANTFSIIGNDKHFSNTDEVIAFLNSIMQQTQKQKQNHSKKYNLLIIILLILLIIFIIIYI
jgi:hypothetical protein